MSSNEEMRLERQKHQLEKQLFHLPSGGDGKENLELNSEQKSTLKQIFQLLREDTDGIPAELSEEHLKLLLKTVRGQQQQQQQQSSNNYGKQDPARQKPPLAGGGKKKAAASDPMSKKQQKEPKKEKEEPPQQPKLDKFGKPIWNYKNMQGKKAVPNSQKDPFYAERKAFIEERRRRRQEMLHQQVEKNEEKFKNYMKDQQQQQQQNQMNDALSVDDNMSEYSTSNRYANQRSMNNQQQQQQVSNRSESFKNQESILNLLNRNLAKNTIYEEDEDAYLRKKSFASNNRDRRAENNYSPEIMLDELSTSPRGFVPFMRTNEFLDPAHSDSPVPPSRESSAVKRSRDKARQVR